MGCFRLLKSAIWANIHSNVLIAYSYECVAPAAFCEVLCGFAEEPVPWAVHRESSS